MDDGTRTQPGQSDDGKGHADMRVASLARHMHRTSPSFGCESSLQMLFDLPSILPLLGLVHHGKRGGWGGRPEGQCGEISKRKVGMQKIVFTYLVYELSF